MSEDDIFITSTNRQAMGVAEKPFKLLEFPKNKMLFQFFDPFTQLALSTHRAIRRVITDSHESSDEDSIRKITLYFLADQQKIEIRPPSIPKTSWIIVLINPLTRGLSGNYQYAPLKLNNWNNITCETVTEDGEPVWTNHTLELMTVDVIRGMEKLFDLICEIYQNPWTRLQVNYDLNSDFLEKIMNTFPQKDYVVDYGFESTDENNRSVRTVLRSLVNPRQIVIKSLAPHDFPFHLQFNGFNMNIFVNCASNEMGLDEISNIPSTAVILYNVRHIPSFLETMIYSWESGAKIKWKALQLQFSDDEYLNFEGLIARENAVPISRLLQAKSMNLSSPVNKEEVYSRQEYRIERKSNDEEKSDEEEKYAFISLETYFYKTYFRFVMNPKTGIDGLPEIHKSFDDINKHFMFWPDISPTEL